MTRDEAKEKAFKCEGFHSGVNYQEHLTDGVWLLRSDVLNFIDKIYDEFENRSCKTCRIPTLPQYIYQDICDNCCKNYYNRWEAKIDKWEVKIVLAGV